MSEDTGTEPVNPPPAIPAGQKKFLIVLGAALVAMLVIGVWYLYDFGAFSSRLSYDRTWAYCESGERCTAIRAPCDSWVAIGDKHLDDARVYYDHMITLVEESPQMECGSAPQGDIEPKAYCLSGICALAQ
jgi:hypothetical protein